MKNRSLYAGMQAECLLCNTSVSVVTPNRPWRTWKSVDRLRFITVSGGFLRRQPQASLIQGDSQTVESEVFASILH